MTIIIGCLLINFSFYKLTPTNKTKLKIPMDIRIIIIELKL